MITLGMILFGTWRIDKTAWWMSAYVCMYAATMAINVQWSFGPTLNFFRTAAWALVLYIIVQNAMCNIDDLKWFYWLSALLGIIMAFNGILVLIGGWSESFTNLLPVLGTVSNTMNAWGFLQVMCFAIAVAWWAQSPTAAHRVLTCVVLVVGITLSLSRTAYTCLVLIVLFTVVGARRRTAGISALIVFAVGGAMWFAIGQLRETLPQAMTFLSNKADTYQSDLNDTRLVAITIEPLMAWARQSPAVWILGDGSTQGHNLLINCLWMTGLLGTSLMIGYHAALFQHALRLWRAGRKTYLDSANLGPTFFALVLVMLLDDILTNLRNHSSVVAYTFAVLAGGLSSAAAWSNCGRKPTALTGARGMVTRAFPSGRATSHQQRRSHPQLNKCRVESAPL